MKLYRNKLIIILLITQAIFVSNFAFSADAHYAKILELDKQIVPNMPSRDKLKLHFQILEEVAKIPTDAKYFIKEINEVLDITLRIVEKNQGILRHEECITSLLGIIKTNLKDKDIRKKLMSIATKNIRYRANGNFNKFINVYSVFLDILYENKYYSEMVDILQHIYTVINLTSPQSKKYYVNFEAFFDKFKDIPNEKIELIFIRIANFIHSRSVTFAFEIYDYYELKHSKSTDPKDLKARIIYILYKNLHYLTKDKDITKSDDAIKKIEEISKSTENDQVHRKAEYAIKLINKLIKTIKK